MINPSAIEMLRKRIPTSGFLDCVTALDILVDELPYLTFREPVAITEINDSGHNDIVNLDANYLRAWSNHIAYSMRSRLRAFEPGIIDELANGRALAAQVLLRSHFEAAAMAALCAQTLMGSDLDALRRLIPQTLFGTALFNKLKRDERVAEMLMYSEQRTITISQAVRALHQFAYPQGQVDDTSLAYSLLCEAAHPNHRGTKHFVQAEEVDLDGEHGWNITYTKMELVPDQLVEKLVEVLIFSMRTGYAATELLRNMQFSNTEDGFIVEGVPEEIGNKIYFDILQNPSTG